MRLLNKLGIVTAVLLTSLVLSYIPFKPSNYPLPEELKAYEQAAFWVCHDRGCGTGWAAGQRRDELLVITAAHVCGKTVDSKEFANNLTVDNIPILRGYIDQENDSCALIIKKPEQALTLELASSTQKEDWVLSRQKISSYKAKLFKIYTINPAQGGWCQLFEGSVRHGSSGSAMIDVSGKVNCMVVLGFDTLEMGACVPLKQLTSFIKKVKQLESYDNRN